MTVVVSLGSNLGDRLAHLQSGLDALPSVARVSSVYETAPIGGPTQDTYLNVVALLADDVTPRAAFEAGQQAEALAGRVRVERWGPRTLDVDVVAASVPVDEPDLQVPHPRAAERAFVLVPWLEADPSAALSGVAVRELVERLDCTGVVRTDLVLEV